MKERPWIWIILANLLLMGGLISLVVVAVKNKQAEVSIIHGR